MAMVNSSLKYALKEWAIAVDALTKGETIVLLRKGGIRERGFQVRSPQIWLYPTYEHQQSELLAPKYASSVTAVESGWHPDRVTIQSYAKITENIHVSEPEQLQALQPYHIWNERMVNERLKWKPQQPLSILLLRVWRLKESVTIPFSDRYGGCKSWIELEPDISTESAVPVLEDAEYLTLTQTIKASVFI